MRALRRRRDDERGVVALEAAIVTPLLLLLVFGMIDMSLMLRDYVSITAASRAGGRLASAEAAAGPTTAGSCDSATDGVGCAPTTVPQMAQDTADAVSDSLTGVPKASIDYLYVYLANDAGYPCKSFTTTAKGSTTCAETANGVAGPNYNLTMPTTSCLTTSYCVKFVWVESKAQFRYSSGQWNSASIDACPASGSSVGVYIRATHKWITGIFPGSLPLNDRAVNKFEPQPVESCNADATTPHP